MKKSSILLVLATITSLSFAQDIIITKDKRQIQAKIMEVSNQEIKYKKFNYQEGPLFTIPVNEIVSIAYENGDVEVYREQNTSINKPSNVILNPDMIGGTFTKEDDFYYLKNQSTMTKMDEKAYLQFIQNNCPEAYNSYKKGNRLWGAGWGLFGAGMTSFFALGIPLYVVGLYNDPYMAIAGSAFLTIGSLSTTASIPLLIVGGIKRNNSHEVYNECNQRDNLTMSLNASPNGIGLALNF